MLKRTTLLLVIFSCCVILLSFVPAKTNQQKAIKTIIVDAGHGIMDNGGHNGAKGTYSYEDDICLAISKELVSELHEQLPEVRVVETRPTERIVALHRRAEIANENRGDLFKIGRA